MNNSTEKILSTRTYKNCYALPLRYFQSEDGVNLFGGGLCCDGVWIRESALFPNSLAPYEFNPDDAFYVDDDVLFLGCTSDVWGHAITDCLKQLWWFRTEDYLNNHKEKIVFYWGPKPLAGNFLELVKLAGVDVPKLHYIDRAMLFRSIIVPDISFNYTEGWACKEYLATIDLIISNLKPIHVKGVEKLFLSERESRRLWGVKSIEKIARSAGYKVYYPADHSLRDQISVLRSAKDVLSFESSIGHNTVFCYPRIHVTMLRKESYTNRYQPIINELREFSVTTVDASLSIMNDKRYPYAGPFFVYPNDSVCQAMISSIYQSESKRFSPSLSFLHKQKNTSLFPFKAFKNYLEYNLWGDKDALAHKLHTISETQADCIAKEISKYRDWQHDRISKLFRFIPLPLSLKERVIRKINKYLVRHLI